MKQTTINIWSPLHQRMMDLIDEAAQEGISIPELFIELAAVLNVREHEFAGFTPRPEKETYDAS